MMMTMMFIMIVMMTDIIATQLTMRKKMITMIMRIQSNILRIYMNITRTTGNCHPMSMVSLQILGTLHTTKLKSQKRGRKTTMENLKLLI